MIAPQEMFTSAADAVLAELAAPPTAKALDRVESDLEATQPGQRVRAVAAERHDHPRAALDHVPGRRAAGQEVRPHRVRVMPATMQADRRHHGGRR
jgi:hypothetical protein